MLSMFMPSDTYHQFYAQPCLTVFQTTLLSFSSGTSSTEKYLQSQKHKGQKSDSKKRLSPKMKCHSCCFIIPFTGSKSLGFPSFCFLLLNLKFFQRSGSSTNNASCFHQRLEVMIPPQSHTGGAWAYLRQKGEDRIHA